MDADRFARLDRANIADIGFDTHNFTEMDAGRAAMGDEFTEPDVPRKAGDRIVSGGNGADVPARRHRKFRIGIMPGKARQLRELR
ncbi:hypothetical protein D3C80_1340230 [compost metagenome]